MDQATVTRMRRLLAEAATLPTQDQQRRMRGPLGTIRRRYLMQEAKLLAARYSLTELLASLVYASGAVALTGLTLEQLEQVVAVLQRLGTGLDVACDSPLAPPAR